MFEEVKRVKIDEVSTYIDEQLEMVLKSVFEENTEGRLWKCDGTYFLWDKGNIVSYVFGEKPSSECFDELPVFIQEEIKKDAEEEGISFFKLRNLTEMSDKMLKSMFGDTEFRTLEKYFYEYKKEDVENFESSLEGLEIMDIDKEMLERIDFRNLDDVVDELRWMWPSLGIYFEKGFGKVAVVEDEIVCWCTAEYVSEGMCGIGIETLDKYRQKGIGTKTATEFVRYCLSRDMTPYWECDASNEASVRLAEKLGFDKLSESQVFLGRL